MDSSATQYDIFLSYSRTDAAAAETLRARLAEAGLRTFLDRYGLPAGQPWQPQLEATLSNSRALVVLLGPSGIGEWQHREIQLGLDRQASSEKASVPFSVIPVLLPHLKDGDTPLGRFLGLNTWIDLRHGLDETEALQRLIAGIQGKTIDDLATAKLLGGLSPYRGLLPFREQDAGLFFGRKRFVDELAAKVCLRTETNTVAVVGRSGSGKSSIVYAGLFPILRQEKGFGSEAVWDILSLRPLDQPLHQLARAFAPPANDSDPITVRETLNTHAERFRHGKVTVADLVRERLLADKGSTRVLLYVDQWEELYTQAQPREIKSSEDQLRAGDARLFVDLLLDAARSSPCTFVLSVRSDFYPDIQNHDALRAAVQEGQVSLGPMSESELRAAIEGPANALGARVQPELTDRLIRDIGLDVTTDQRDQYDIGKLPLLEYALERAWAQRTDAEIGLAHYAGLEQALEQRANQLFEALSPTQRMAAKRLFVSLVMPGEGREDTRARIILPTDPDILSVVETFAGAQARLIVTGDVAGRRSAEVSHEALIRHWERLRTWVDENRENLRIYTALVADRTEWVRHNRHPSLLIEPGLRLEAARKLHDQPGDVVIDDVNDYISASLARQERRRRWRNVASAAAVVIAAVMAGLAWWAYEARQTARDQQVLAESQKRIAVSNETRALSALSRVALGNRHATDALKLAMAAWPRRVDDDRPRLEVALKAMSDALSAEQPPVSLLMRDGQVVGARLTRNDQRILSWSEDGTVRLWDAATGRPAGNPLHHDAIVRGALLSHDERRILSWSDDKTLRLWDATTEKLAGPPMRHDGPVQGALFSHDETHILSWSKDGTLRLWDAGTGQLVVPPMQHQGGVIGALFAKDEQSILSWSSDKTLRLWDTGTGRSIGTAMTHGDIVRGAIFIGDERRILSWSDDATAQVWDVGTNQPAGSAMLHDGGVAGAILLRDGERVLTWSGEKLRIWELSTGRTTRPPMLHDGQVLGANIAQDGNRIVSWSSDKTLRLWDGKSGEVVAPPVHHDAMIRGVLLSPDEERILSWSADGNLLLWDAATGQPSGRAVHQNVGVVGALLTTNQRRIVSWSDDGNLRLWEAATGQPIGASMHQEVGVLGALLAQDESRILSWSADGSLRLWDAATGKPLDPVMRHADMVRGVVLSRDQQRIVSWSTDGTVRQWNATSGEPRGPAIRHEGGIRGALLTRDEQRIVSWSADGVLRMWDLETAKPISLAFRAEAGFLGAILMNDERRILTWCGDNTLRIWDLVTGQQIGHSMRHENQICGARLINDESRILSWSDDKTLRQWDAATGQPLASPMRHNDEVLGATTTNGDRVVLSWSKDNTLRSWDAATGQQAGRVMHHFGVVRGAALLAGGTLALSWSDDKTLRLWDVATGQPSGPVMHHNGRVQGAVVTRSAERILSWSDDMTLRLWDVATGQPIGQSMRHEGRVWGAVLTQDEQRILSWSDEGTLQMWDINWPRGNLLQIACSLLPDYDMKEVSDRHGISINEPICGSMQRETNIDWRTIETAPSR